MQHDISRVQHDEAVRLFALQLQSQGYDVRARVEGWFQAPDSVNGYRPDIVVRKGSHLLIIEVEKGDVDWPKISALKRSDIAVVVVSPEDAILKRMAELQF
jgi:hypothetical protein